jgi:glycosyltransferase involved in cell wall biosynthesis
MQSNGQKPRVMIVIATDIIGGPGKGLFQFLRFADLSRFDYLLCNYDRAGMAGCRDDFLDKAVAEGIPVHRLHQRALIDPTLVLRAFRVVKRHRINIVQTHGYKSNVLGFLLKLLFGIRWIAFAHGYTAESKKIALYNRIDLWCYRYADLSVVVSEPLKKLLLANRVRPERLFKLPNAVDIHEIAQRTMPSAMRQTLGLRQGRPVIGVIGRLSLEKGQMVFLEAFCKLKARFSGLTALMIGDGPEKDRLVRFCRERDIAGEVRFTGHVNNIGDYYRILDVVVIPSYSEGLPNVLLEAMAIGVPVVSTEVGAVGEVMNGMSINMVPPGDSTALAKRITRFLSEPDLVRLSVAQGKAIIASRYNPAARARNLVDLYDRVLSD